MAEKTLKRIIHSRLTLIFVIVTIIIIFAVLFFVNGFIRDTLCSYMYGMTADSIRSSLGQFEETMLALEEPYDRMLRNMLRDYKTAVEGSNLDEDTLNNNLRLLLSDYHEQIDILGIDDQIFSNIYYDVINEEGGIIVSNHREGNFDVNAYEFISAALNDNETILEHLTFNSNADISHKGGYISLGNNQILKLSIPLSIDFYHNIAKDFDNFSEGSSFVSFINVYRGLSEPLSNLYPSVSQQDLQYFSQLDDDGSFRKVGGEGHSTTYYARMDPDFQNFNDYLPADPYFIKLNLSFNEELIYLSRTIMGFIAVVLLLAVITVFVFNRQLSRKITVPFVKLADNMSKLGSEKFTEMDRDIDRTDIKEVNMLLASYQEMAGELSATFEELKAINEELENAYQESSKLANSLNNVINVANRLTDSVFEDKEKFLIEVFYAAKRIIPEADYGDVFIVEGEDVKHIDTIGHDLEKIKSLPLTLEYMKSRDRVNFIDNIENEDYDRNYEYLRNKILEVKKDIKSSLTVQLSIGKELAGGLCFDIAAESNKKFSNHSIKTIKAFGSLATAFLTMQRYKNIHEKFQREIILSSINILEIHDSYTKGHSENVSRISTMIAREMGFSVNQVKMIEWAGLVHDIGKILISKEILNKPGILTADEYDSIKKHTIWGYEVLISSEDLKDIGVYVRHHHERWDGRGYPDQLKGEEIPLFSRIIALADSWDTMRSDRVYRKKLTKEKAVRELFDNRGTQFDPQVVDVALQLIHEDRLE